MSFDIATLIGDIILAGGGVAAAMVTRHHVKNVQNDVRATHAKVVDLERRTVSDQRITQAVTEYVEQNPGELGEAILEDALRRLLIAIVDDNYPEGESNERNRSRRRNG